MLKDRQLLPDSSFDLSYVIATKASSLLFSGLRSNSRKYDRLGQMEKRNATIASERNNMAKI